MTIFDFFSFSFSLSFFPLDEFLIESQSKSFVFAQQTLQRYRGLVEGEIGAQEGKRFQVDLVVLCAGLQLNHWGMGLGPWW